VCYSTEEKRIYVAQVRPGNNKLEFEEVKLDDLASLAVSLQLELIWSTKETFLFKSSASTAGLSNLYLFNRQSLIKKYENLNSFNLIVKDSNQLLIYAKYLGASVIKYALYLTFL